MIKNTVAVCLLLLFSLFASARTDNKADTLVFGRGVPPIDPLVAYQNLLYKKRLDSLQKTVPLSYNEDVQKYIDIYASRKGQIAKVLGLSRYYFPIFEKSLREQNIPDEIKFLSVVESALDPNAVSRVGATGPWQFMFTTAIGYGLTIDGFVDERKDPVSASQAAAAYFRDAFNEFGDWLLAVAAYNCGKGAVTRAIEKSGGKYDFWSIRPFLPLETRNYVPAFIATTYIMSCYKSHNIIPSDRDAMPETDNIQVNSSISLSAVAKAINSDLAHLALLNPSYKKNVVNGSPDKPKRLVIPHNTESSVFASLYEVLNGPAFIAVEPEKEPLPLLKNKPAAKSYVSYKVKPGDTLSDIAEKFTASVAAIKLKNKLKGNVIQPGMVLRIRND